MLGADQVCPNFFDLIVGYCTYLSFARKQQQQTLPDPWVDTITGGTLQLANLVNWWLHMH